MWGWRVGLVVLTVGGWARRFSYDASMDPEVCVEQKGGSKKSASDNRCDWMEKAESVEHCEFEVARLGLWPDSARAEEDRLGPQLILTCRGGKERIVLEPGTGERGPAIETLTGADKVLPVLCLDRNAPVPSREEARGLVVLLVASSVEYLFRLWPYFVHKLIWARKMGVKLALWIGELAPEVATSVSDECLNSSEMRNADAEAFKHMHLDRQLSPESLYLGTEDVAAVNSNHHIKMLAAYAALRLPTVDGLYYVDMDTIAGPDKLLGNSSRTHMINLVNTHADNKTDVLFQEFLGGAQKFSFWRVKGRTFYVRDSPLGRLVIVSWLHWRCGFKDQLSLWHTLLTTAADNNCLPYRGEVFTSHSYSQLYRGACETQDWCVVSCKNIHQQCPNFRGFCVDGQKSRYSSNLPMHGTIDSESTRSFRFFDPDTRHVRTMHVQDAFPGKNFSDFMDQLYLHVDVDGAFAADLALSSADRPRRLF